MYPSKFSRCSRKIRISKNFTEKVAFHSFDDLDEISILINKVYELKNKILPFEIDPLEIVKNKYIEEYYGAFNAKNFSLFDGKTGLLI